MAPKTITYPRVWIKNKELIDCQIIRNEKQMKEFMKKDKFRRCLIEDYDNFQHWKNGEAPYNDENMSFGIRRNLFEAFSGETFLDFPKKNPGLITAQRWAGMKNGEV